VCGDACRREKWDREHGIYNLDSEIWVRVPASAIRPGHLLRGDSLPRGDYHEVALDQALERVRLAIEVFAAGESPERATEVCLRLLDALRPWARRIDRRGTAYQRDALDVHAYLNPVIAELKAEAETKVPA